MTEHWAATQSFGMTYLELMVRWRDDKRTDFACKGVVPLDTLSRLGVVWLDFAVDGKTPAFGNRARQPYLLMDEPGGLPLCVMQLRENGRIAFFTLTAWAAFSLTITLDGMTTFGVTGPHSICTNTLTTIGFALTRQDHD